MKEQVGMRGKWGKMTIMGNEFSDIGNNMCDVMGTGDTTAGLGI